MEQILEKLETLIDDIERDFQLTKDEIYNKIKEIKSELEDHQLRRDEESSIEWDDLD
tara:strand:+ start:530 stop:700 length:171 start_codon:yes stop_codon:yes gene_type:complete